MTDLLPVALVEPAKQHLRRQKLDNYIFDLRKCDEITEQVAIKVRDTWKAIFDETKAVVPNASVGGDGQMILSWNTIEHHLELEVFSDRPGEWFYLNRLNSENWEEDYQPGDTLSSRVISYLKYFV